ncbi:MAG TPA: LytR C-terminal domain-containing protein [Acidimicrobiales bacterium]|nr:LytR C-terminal domain-containing protein [Acidimicrobiales bacterium]
MSFPKAAVLIVVAVVLGIVLLHAATSSPSNGSVGPATTTTSTTTPGQRSTTTTTTTTPPSQDVKVMVANGSSTTGAAGFFTTKLGSAGWGTLTATDTSTPVSASAVYYAAGQQAPATAIAGTLGLKPSVVQPLTTSVPVTGTTGADVVVVIGPDLSSQVTSSS